MCTDAGDFFGDRTFLCDVVMLKELFQLLHDSVNYNWFIKMQNLSAEFMEDDPNFAKVE